MGQLSGGPPLAPRGRACRALPSACARLPPCPCPASAAQGGCPHLQVSLRPLAPSPPPPRVLCIPVLSHSLGTPVLTPAPGQRMVPGGGIRARVGRASPTSKQSPVTPPRALLCPVASLLRRCTLQRGGPVKSDPLPPSQWVLPPRGLQPAGGWKLSIQ